MKWEYMNNGYMNTWHNPIHIFFFCVATDRIRRTTQMDLQGSAAWTLQYRSHCHLSQRNQLNMDYMLILFFSFFFFLPFRNTFLSAHACGEPIGRMPLAALRFSGRSAGQFIKHCFYDFEVLVKLRTTQIHYCLAQDRKPVPLFIDYSFVQQLHAHSYEYSWLARLDAWSFIREYS